MTDNEIPTLEHTIDGRRSMRSIADALEALRKMQLLPEDSSVEIRMYPLPLATAEPPFIVLVVSKASSLDHIRGVALPTSHGFRGRRLGGEATETFAIPLLDRATVDKNGIVTLADSTCLSAVNVIPAPLPWELTDLEKRIVYWTIKFIGQEAEAACFLYGPPSPTLEGLDYAQLPKLDVPKLEAIVRYIEINDSELPVCRQTVANALGRSGMRAPLDRRRRNSRGARSAPS